MELQLIRSFIEVAESGSFAAASERLLVTQSAVSLRIQRLEEQLGRALFLRSKDGVTLTPAGHAFQDHARAILDTWEEARQKVGSAEDGDVRLCVGAQVSLWPRFGLDWLERMRLERADLMLRAEMARSETLMQMLGSGSAQVVLIYSQQHRPGLRAEPLFDDLLVMVAGWQDASIANLGPRYLLCDWGDDFLRRHEELLPHLQRSRLTLSPGSLTLDHLARGPFAAYLPARLAAPDIARGKLHLVQDAPQMSMPAWAIWRDGIGGDLLDVAQTTLRAQCQMAENDIFVAIGRL